MLDGLITVVSFGSTRFVLVILYIYHFEIGEHLAQNLGTLRRELRSPFSCLHPRRRRIKQQALKETPNGFDSIFSEILLAVADGRAKHTTGAKRN